MGRFEVTDAQEQEAAGYPTAVVRRTPRLSWTDAAGSHEVEIEGRKLLGAAPDVDLIVEDNRVSRLHAELDLQESGLWVRDLGSRNGTFVEGIRVGSACVPDGGKLRVGDTELAVAYAPRPVPVELWPEASFGALLGPSAVMRQLFARLHRIAASEATVLIQGETGTGKELVARAIHDASPRAGGPFVIIDCGALPDTLLEAELFGHAKGAFTGAQQARIGAIEAADGGSVFLDEIGELPLTMQPKLLRVLESRTVRPLGEPAHRPVDVRFISATHRDLGSLVNSRAFREDLYFRLAVLPVHVPPLRERPGDILALVKLFLPREALGSLPADLLRELMGRAWLGNVRELRNFVERLAALGPRDAFALAGGEQPRPDQPVTLPAELLTLPYKELCERTEVAYLRALLARHDRNVAAAAAASGLNRAYLYRLMRKHEL